MSRDWCLFFCGMAFASFVDATEMGYLFGMVVTALACAGFFGAAERKRVKR